MYSSRLKYIYSSFRKSIAVTRLHFQRYIVINYLYGHSETKTNCSSCLYRADKQTDKHTWQKYIYNTLSKFLSEWADKVYQRLLRHSGLRQSYSLASTAS